MEDSSIIRRKISGKCVGIAFFILLCVIIVQVVVLAAVFTRCEKKTENDQDESECRTPECLYLSQQFRSSMNLEVDPCNNFYEYACGHFNSNVKAERSSVYKVSQILKDTDFELRSRAEKLARQYFLSCVDRDGVEAEEMEPFLEYLEEMGGWGSSQNASQWSLQTTLETAHLYKQNLLFTWDVSDDTKNSTTIITMEREHVNMSKPLQWQLGPGDDLLELLHSTLTKILPLTPLEIDLHPIVDLHSRLGRIPKPAFDPDIERALKRFKIADLQDELPFLDWLKFFNRAFAEVNITLDPGTEVLVEDLDYFKQLSDVISSYLKTEQRKSVLAGYLNFQMLFDLSGLALSITEEEYSEEEIDGLCLDATKELLPFAVSAIYVREFVDQSSMAQLRTLADAVRYKFEETIASADWLDSKSHKATLEKANKIRLMLGYQKFILDQNLVDSKYADLRFQGEVFFERVLEGRLFRRKSSCRQLTAPFDSEDLGDDVSPSEYNAFYVMSRNTVVIPAAYTQLPRYNVFFPRYAQFGIMGFTIGHELFHSLDNTGRQFDLRGNVHQWWESSSIRRFDKRTRCFVEQFANYSTHGMQLNGNETLGENLADFGGLKVAFKAYQSWLRSGVDLPRLPQLDLDNEQLFFLSFAQDFCADYGLMELRNLINNDEHTPNEFRIIGTLRNMPEFAKVYSCSNGTAMNPPKKCDLW